MTWSKLKSGMEGFFADGVKGRIGLHMTSYRRPGRGDDEGRSWITIDGEELINMPLHVEWARNTIDRHEPELGREFELASRLGQNRLKRAMIAYQELSIEAILASEDSVVRALGMLDRRVGKRRLGRMDLTDQPPLVKYLYLFRCGIEGIRAKLEEDPETLKRRLGRAHRPPHETAEPNPEEEDGAEANEAAVDPADAKLASASKHNLAALIRRMHADQVEESELRTEVARLMLAAFRSLSDRDALRDLLVSVESQTDLLGSAAYASGVIALASRSDAWLRGPSGWKARSHNEKKQFSSLARHLYADYDVPRFMDRVWMGGDTQRHDWFRHVGAGKNIRTAEGLPISLNKRMAHFFLQAPDDYSVEAALRYGQVMSLDGDPGLADAIRETPLVREFRDDAFWLSVLRFFVDNPMLDRAHVQPIVDYICSQRYEPVIVFVERGVAEERPPLQPNFTMRGRTAESLLRAVDEWHGRLGREQSGGDLQWRKSPVADYVQREGSAEGKEMQVWRIRELVSSKELIAEGRAQGHCVASYAKSCFQGKCSIWTMEIQTFDGIDKRLTIEVGLPQGEIRQVRGLRNRRATRDEMRVVTNWAMQSGLSLATYL